MVRKRDAWTRARDAVRIRPKTPAPTTGWRIAELTALSGRPRSTIATYVRHGVLDKPAFRGTATRYGRLHLLRLLCVEHVRGAPTERLKSIKQRLDAMNEAELVALVAARAPSAALVTALGLAAPSAAARASPNGGGNEGRPTIADGALAESVAVAPLPGEAGRRVPLLPGLELWMAADASAAVREVARRIWAYCSRA